MAYASKPMLERAALVSASRSRTSPPLHHTPSKEANGWLLASYCGWNASWALEGTLRRHSAATRRRHLMRRFTSRLYGLRCGFMGRQGWARSFFGLRGAGRATAVHMAAGHCGRGATLAQPAASVASLSALPEVQHQTDAAAGDSAHAARTSMHS